MKREFDKVYNEVKKIAGSRAFSVSIENKSWEDKIHYAIYIADSSIANNDYIIKYSNVSFEDVLNMVKETIKERTEKGQNLTI